MFKFKLGMLYLLLLISLALTACSRTVIARDEWGTAVPDPPAVSNDDPALIVTLEATGAQVEKVGEVNQPFFSVPGQVVRLNGNEVQLFIYADETIAKSEADQVSPTGTAVATSMMSWMATPHFYRSDSTIALYIGDDAATLTLLEGVLGPQFAGG